MFRTFAGQPSVVLVDDDFFSARQMIRYLGTAGAGPVTHFASADLAVAGLLRLTHDGATPDLVVVDLKSSSAASAVFIAQLLAGQPGLFVVAMAPSLDRDVREALHQSGAVAVFERCADLTLFKRETSAIIEFWRRQGVATAMAL